MAGLRGAGKVYLSIYRNSAYGAFYDMSNIASIALGNSGASTVNLKSTAPANYGTVIGSTTTPGDDTISIVLNDPNRKNLSNMLLGTDTTVTSAGATVSNEAHTVVATGSVIPLTYRHISAVTVTSKDADSASAHATTTAYSLGDYVTATVSTVPSYFKCTTAGTSGGSAPSFVVTTPGTSTTTDGTVTWTYMGKITKVADIDYLISSDDADNGLIEILSTNTGGFELGRDINVDYTYGAYTGYSIDARTETELNCKMLFLGQNLDSGEIIRVTANSVKLSPEGDFNLISADGAFLEFTLSGTIAVPTGETVPFVVEVIT